MPKFPDARSGAAFRAGDTHPKPPRHMKADAKAVWDEIVQARPVDYFRSGSTHILEQLCALIVAQRINLRDLAQCPTDPDVIDNVRKLSPLIATCMRQLRLTVQAEVDRRSAKAGEKAVPASPFLGGMAIERSADAKPN